MGRKPRMCLFCFKIVTKIKDHFFNVHKLNRINCNLALQYCLINDKTHLICEFCNRLVALVKGSLDSYKHHVINWHKHEMNNISFSEVIERGIAQFKKPFPYHLFQDEIQAYTPAIHPGKTKSF